MIFEKLRPSLKMEQISIKSVNDLSSQKQIFTHLSSEFPILYWFRNICQTVEWNSLLQHALVRMYSPWANMSFMWKHLDEQNLLEWTGKNSLTLILIILYLIIYFYLFIYIHIFLFLRGVYMCSYFPNTKWFMPTSHAIYITQ